MQPSAVPYNPRPYIGRFAPSPTGPLHFGSLVAAVASYLDARSHDGKWLLRIEDIDKPREMRGATAHILKTLADFGFEWDGEVTRQSSRIELYEHALLYLQKLDFIYPCSCTRKEIADSSNKSGIEGLIYPRTCLSQPLKPDAPFAWRVKTMAENIEINDRIQGKIKQDLNRQIGDFIIKRADGLFAYQLAVVVDDAAQGVTDIVRGADLLNSTARQVYLQRLLNLPTPHYAHVPVVTNDQGEKLSKQTLAAAIYLTQASKLLYQALLFLGQQPPSSLQNAPLAEIWVWAGQHWQLGNIATTHSRHLQ